MDVVKFGAFLKQLRKEKGLTQEQLAEQLRVTNRTISRWETGANLPDIDILIELSDFYEIDIKELLNGQRRSLKAEQEELELALMVSEYNTAKDNPFIGKAFMATIAAFIAISISFFTTFKFFQDTTHGGMVLLTLVFSMLIYSIVMQGFQECKSTKGYLITLVSGFTSIVLSNILILVLFFRTGSYYNHGVLGFYYVIGINIVTFSIAGMVTKSLCRNKNII